MTPRSIRYRTDDVARTLRDGMRCHDERKTIFNGKQQSDPDHAVSERGVPDPDGGPSTRNSGWG